MGYGTDPILSAGEIEQLSLLDHERKRGEPGLMFRAGEALSSPIAGAARLMGFGRDVDAVRSGIVADVVAPLLRSSTTSGEQTGMDRFADTLHRFSGAQEQVAQERGFQGFAGNVQGAVRGGVRSAVPMAAAGMIGGTPLVIGQAGAAQYSSALQEGRDAGLQGGDLQGYAATQGGIEAGVTAIFSGLNRFIPGLGGAENAITAPMRKGLADALKQAGIRTVAELGEEEIIAVSQQAARALHGVDPAAMSPEKLYDTMYKTGLQTLVVSGAVNTPSVVAGRTNDIAKQRQAFSAPTNVARVVADARKAGKAQSLEALAQKPQPTRSDWESAGLDPKMGKSAAERTQFAESLRGVLSNPVAQAESAPAEPLDASWSELPEGAHIPPGLQVRESDGKRYARWPVSPQRDDSIATDALAEADEQSFRDLSRHQTQRGTTRLDQLSQWLQTHDMLHPQYGVYEDAFRQELESAGLAPPVTERPTPPPAEALGIAPEQQGGVPEFALGMENRRQQSQQAAQQAEADRLRQEAAAANQPDVRLSPGWQAVPKDTPPAPGVEMFQHPDGRTFVRRASGPALQHRLDQRREELKSMPMAQLSQEASRYAIKRDRSRNQKIEAIIARETDEALKPTAPRAKPQPGVQEAYERVTGLPFSEDTPAPAPFTRTPRREAYDTRYLDQKEPVRAEPERVPVPEAQPAPPAAPERSSPTPPTQVEAAPLRVEPSFQPPLTKGRKPVTRESVARVFPGAKVTSKPNGWRVEVGQSFVDVDIVQEIPLDRAQLERQMGKAVTDAEFSKLTGGGSFSLRTDDGKVHDGLGIIRLANGLGTDATLRHEALHLARRAGLLTEKEWKALANKYGTPGANDSKVEEDVANSREAWSGEKSLWNKIKSWLNRVLDKFGITKATARDIHNLLDDSGFWQRAGKKPEGESYQVANREQEVAKSIQAALDAKTPVQVQTDKWTYRVTGIKEGKLRTTSGTLLPIGPIAEGKWSLVSANNIHTTAAKALAETEAIGSTYSVVARPDLANPGETQAVRNLVDETDRQRNEAGQPETRPDAEVQAEAQQRLAADYSGERKKLLDIAASGGQLDDTDTVIAKSIVNREGIDAIMSGDKQAVLDAIKLIDSYRRTGTEQARAFRQRHDPVETPAERNQRMLVEAILSPPEKTRQRIAKARSEGDNAAADKLQKDWSNEFDNLKKKLLGLGVDLDDLNKHGYDPRKAAQALGVVQAAKAGFSDKMFEYWRNAILSSPKTQAANIVGNFGHAAWHFTAERLLEAGLNKVVGQAEGAQTGELPHLYGAVLPGLSRAARNFLLTFQTELPQFDKQLGREGQFRFETPNIAIQGKKGRVVRLPQRLLLAVDDFAKTLFANMEVAAHAYRIAKSEGLKGEEMRQRMSALTADLESPAWDAAYDQTLELTFQQHGSTVARKVKQNILAARRDLPGLRYLVPFVTTPLNILETAVKKSPLGSIALAQKMYANYKAGKPVFQGATAQAAQQMLAWGVVLALMGNDEEDPWITGAESSFSRGTRALAQRTRPPQSIKLGDKWVSYSRVEPFATVLASAVDWVNALSSGNAERSVKTPVASIVGQLKDKTFLQGIGDLLQAVESENTTEGVGRWSANFAVSWVPNLVRTTGRAADDSLQQRGVWGDGRDWWAMLGKRAAQQTEVASLDSQPIHDLWGREVPMSDSPVPFTDWLYRMTVPADNRKEDIFVGDKLMMNWNNQHPDDPKYGLPPLKSYTFRGKKDFLTDEQYAQYTKLAGELTRKAVERGKWNVDEPTEGDMKRLESIIENSRKAAKARILTASAATASK